MSSRGQYGTHVGASLVHTLELKQRYNNVSTAAVQSLLNELSREGAASSAGYNRWEISLRDGAWVRFMWYPDHSALEITITDKELRRVEEMDVIRRRYEAILARITPRLQRFGVTTVGGTIYAPSAPVVGLAPIIPLGIAVLAATSLTPGDIASAIKEINTGFKTLHDEVMKEAGFSADPYREASGPIWDWWKITGVPIIEEWQKFQADALGSWTSRFFGHASRPGTLKRWHERLVQLRNEAQKRVDLKSLDPIQPEMPLPQHIYEGGGKVIKKVGEAAQDVWDLAKYGLYGLLGLGAIVALSSVASNLRSGKDPGEKYMELVRSRRALPRGEGDDE